MCKVLERAIEEALYEAEIIKGLYPICIELGWDNFNKLRLSSKLQVVRAEGSNTVEGLAFQGIPLDINSVLDSTQIRIITRERIKLEVLV